MSVPTHKLVIQTALTGEQRMPDTEEPELDPDDLVELKDRGEGTFGVLLTGIAEIAGIERGDLVYPELDYEGPGPHPDLILGKVEDESQRTRTVTGNKAGSLMVRIPTETARAFVGREDYDTDNPFLFEPLPGDGIIGLIGLGRADDVLDTTPEEEDTEEGGEKKEKDWSHSLIPEQTIQIAADSTTATPEQIKQGIDVVTQAIDAIETLETVEEYDTLQVDEYEIQFVEKDLFASIGKQAGLDQDIVDGVEIALELAVETETEERGLTDYRGFKRRASPVLTAGQSNSDSESEQQTLSKSTE